MGHLELLCGFETHPSGKLSSWRRVRSMGGDALMEMQIGGVGEGVFHQHHGVVCFSCGIKGGGYISTKFVRHMVEVRFWFGRDV